jgi:hypothetical protein
MAGCQIVGKITIMNKLLLYFLVLSSSMVFFVIFAVVFLNGTAVQCEQQADDTYTCSIQTLLLGEIPIFNREITRVTGVETFEDGCFEGCAYRTEFILADESTVPLTETYTDQSPVNLQTAELKTLLNSGQASFEYQKEPTWWVMYLLGGLFIMDLLITTFVLGIPALREYQASRHNF